MWRSLAFTGSGCSQAAALLCSCWWALFLFLNVVECREQVLCPVSSDQNSFFYLFLVSELGNWICKNARNSYISWRATWHQLEILTHPRINRCTSWRHVDPQVCCFSWANLQIAALRRYVSSPRGAPCFVDVKVVHFVKAYSAKSNLSSSWGANNKIGWVLDAPWWLAAENQAPPPKSSGKSNKENLPSGVI